VKTESGGLKNLENIQVAGMAEKVKKYQNRLF